MNTIYGTVKRSLVLSLIVIMLSACASGPETPDRSQPTDPAEPASDEQNLLEDLLARAGTMPSPQAERAALQAADMLLDMDREEEALSLLDETDLDQLDAILATEILVLKARLLMDQQQWQDALTQLNAELPDSLPRLPESLRRQIRLYRSEIFLNTGDPLASAQERIYADALLPASEREANHEGIWNALVSLPSSRLGTLAENSLVFEFQGWYELAMIGKTFQYNLDRQVIELERWSQAWSRHPAARVLPRAMQLVQTLAEERPARIALLLPLKTPAGQVVRDGFMSAYYNVQEFGGQVPEISFYDTTRITDIRELHDQAREDGAEMIIGPLQRQHVAQLQEISNLRIPTLALNSIDGSRPRSSQLYQFALSPESEARQIAERAWRDGHRYAAVLSPEDVAGDESLTYTRKRESFIRRFRELGGTVVAQEIYRDDYTTVIENLLNLSDSEFRRQQLSELIDRPLAFTQRRRQDVDFIFMIAPPGAARQINPSLAYLYAGDLQVYATQDVYSGIPRPLIDGDLNGILFSESPWLLANEDELRSQAQALFPQNSSLFLRLQAFGVDAFRLYPRLKQLEEVGDSQIYGATGLLKMDNNRSINQEFYWARFVEGRAQPEEQVIQ